MTVTVTLCLLVAVTLWWLLSRLSATRLRSALAAPWRTFCRWQASRCGLRHWRAYVDLKERAGVDPVASPELARLLAAERTWIRRSFWGST